MRQQGLLEDGVGRRATWEIGQRWAGGRQDRSMPDVVAAKVLLEAQLPQALAVQFDVQT